MKLSEAKIGDRVRLGITKDGLFMPGLLGIHRCIEVVIAGRTEELPRRTYVVWENWVPEFDNDFDPSQDIRRHRRQQYRIPHKFRCGYHISDNLEVEMIQAAKPSSTSSLPLLLTCIGAGAAFSTLASQSMTSSNQSQSQKEQR
jgi:hypothetical protein